MAQGTEEEDRDVLRSLRPEQADLYASLNIGRNASHDEIRAAYLRVAAALHPDKQHAASGLRADAERQFLVIDRAYKVLSEPLLRQTYDLHGERGLRLLQSVPPHEIIPVRYPIEVSYILNELIHDETNFTALSALGSSGTVTLQCEVPRPLALPVVKQMAVDHQVEVPITSATTLFGGIYVANRKPVSFGMGYVGTRVRLSKQTWASGTYVMGFKKKFTVETGHELSRSTSARASLSLGEGGQASVKLATSHRLSSRLTSDVEMGVGGNEDAISGGLTMVRGKGEVSGRLKLAVSEIAVRCTYQHRFTNALHGKFMGKVGTRGVELFVVGMRNINNITGINLGLSVTLTGVSITFKARRGRVNLYLPIQIGRGLDPWSLVVGGLIQAAVNAGIISILRPFERVRVQRELRALERQLSERQCQARRNAAAQVRLMLGPSQRKKTAELAHDGLVILTARYGLKTSTIPDPDWYVSAKDHDSDLDNAGSLDVTVPLQFFIKDSHLSLPAGSKAGILGFYDVASNPAWLFEKQPANSQEGGPEPYPPNMTRKTRTEYPSLYVKYRYKGSVYEMTIDDLRPLDLPATEGEAICVGPVTRVAA